MVTDVERIDFLESLLERTVFMNKENPSFYQSTDIHITGPDSCSIYARTGVGSRIAFKGEGASVREAIDAAMVEAAKRGENDHT